MKKSNEIFVEIKKRRTSLKLTQADLAEIAGISLRNLKAIETGEGNPSFASLTKILDVLGMELELKVRK